GRVAADHGQLGHPPDQRRRQVVDHEVAEVLQHLGRLRAAGHGQPGDHDELHRGGAQPVLGPKFLRHCLVTPPAAPCKWSYTTLASWGPTPGTCSSSSRPAWAALRADPKWRTSWRRRVSPPPGMSSSTLRVMDRSRSLRW